MTAQRTTRRQEKILFYFRTLVALAILSISFLALSNSIATSNETTRNKEVACHTKDAIKKVIQMDANLRLRQSRRSLILINTGKSGISPADLQVRKVNSKDGIDTASKINKLADSLDC